MLSLLFELRELSPVVYGGQQLPDEQQGQADQHNADDHAEHNGQDVHGLWTLLMPEGGHCQTGLAGAHVLELVTTVIGVVDELTKLLADVLVHLQVVLYERLEVAFRILGHRIVTLACVLQRSGVPDLTTYTVPIQLTLGRTRRTLLTEGARVVELIGGVTLADAADAFATTAAQLGIAVLDAGLVRRRTRTVLADVARVADAATAHALAMILAGTKEAILTRTVPVVTLAVLAVVVALHLAVEELLVALARATATLTAT